MVLTGECSDASGDVLYVVDNLSTSSGVRGVKFCYYTSRWQKVTT